MKEEKQKAGRYQLWTIPNILSMLRILLIPVFVYTYISLKKYYLTAGLIILSGLTDLADGFIARHFNQVTDIGKFLDPLADKLTQIAAMFCLTTRFNNMIYPLVILIIKELAGFILGGLVFTHMNKTVEGADWYGKVATTILYFTFFMHFIWADITSAWSNGLIILSTVALLFAAVLYLIRYIRTLTGKRTPKA